MSISIRVVVLVTFAQLIYCMFKKKVFETHFAIHLQKIYIGMQYEEVRKYSNLELNDI